MYEVFDSLEQRPVVTFKKLNAAFARAKKLNDDGGYSESCDDHRYYVREM